MDIFFRKQTSSNINTAPSAPQPPHAPPPSNFAPPVPPPPGFRPSVTGQGQPGQNIGWVQPGSKPPYPPQGGKFILFTL